MGRTVEKAGVPHWHPNQLRHLFATEVRKAHGLEAAQVLLGHSRADVTQVYAERDLALALAVASCIGIEPPQNSHAKPQSAGHAAQKAAHTPTDPDLATLIVTWPHLPEAIKAAIRAMVRAVGG